MKKKSGDILLQLPPELISMIFRYLNVTDLASVIEVNENWKQHCIEDPILRKRLDNYVTEFRKIPIENRIPQQHGTLCKYYIR